jgi:protein-S-isoprenylcysteine O-methyltransferase Ste14
MSNIPADHDQNSGTKHGKLTTFLRNLILPTYLPCFGHEELSNDIRNVMLVAVALVAAVTFQAGISPPGGVWQDTKKEIDDQHVAGQAIYSSQRVPFYFFLICNTLAFSSSIYLLLSLTFGYPFFLEVFVATFSMSGTYAAAIFSVTPYESANFRLIALVAALPIIIRPVICLLSRMIRTKGCFKHERTNKV